MPLIHIALGAADEAPTPLVKAHVCHHASLYRLELRYAAISKNSAAAHAAAACECSSAAAAAAGSAGAGVTAVVPALMEGGDCVGEAPTLTPAATPHASSAVARLPPDAAVVREVVTLAAVPPTGTLMETPTTADSAGATATLNDARTPAVDSRVVKWPLGTAAAEVTAAAAAAAAPELAPKPIRATSRARQRSEWEEHAARGGTHQRL